MRRVFAVLVLLPVVACGSSPAGPSSPDSPASSAIRGQTVNAIDGAPVAGTSVSAGASRSATSDGSGNFQLDVGGSGTYAVVVQGSSVVERDTSVPTGDRVRLSLIPASFDLASFDQMARTTNDRLQRWTARPALVILASTMQYRSGGGEMYPATAGQLTEGEISQLTAHLTEGLTLLSGMTYASFASVSVERPSSGTEVDVMRPGSIVVGRYIGIESAGHTVGYGQWATLPDGTVAGGAMFLDRDFDRGDSRRRLLRIHELGHALGYQHVTSTPSVMRPTIGPEPSEFDRAAALIAYQRPVGNRSPDIDPPAGSQSVVTGGGLTWSPPTICK